VADLNFCAGTRYFFSFQKLLLLGFFQSAMPFGRKAKKDKKVKEGHNHGQSPQVESPQVVDEEPPTPETVLETAIKEGLKRGSGSSCWISGPDHITNDGVQLPLRFEDDAQKIFGVLQTFTHAGVLISLRLSGLALTDLCGINFGYWSALQVFVCNDNSLAELPEALATCKNMRQIHVFRNKAPCLVLPGELLSGLNRWHCQMSFKESKCAVSLPAKIVPSAAAGTDRYLVPLPQGMFDNDTKWCGDIIKFTKTQIALPVLEKLGGSDGWLQVVAGLREADATAAMDILIKEGIETLDDLVISRELLGDIGLSVVVRARISRALELSHPTKPTTVTNNPLPALASGSDAHRQDGHHQPSIAGAAARGVAQEGGKQAASALASMIGM
jgi:hypothetical protein